MLAARGDGTARGPQVITGEGLSLWCATARPLVNQSNVGGADFTEANRNRTLCYAKGLRERVKIQTSESDPWQWRRICFTMKGQFPLAAQGGIDPGSYITVNNDNPNRVSMQRTLVPFPGTSPEFDFLALFIFRGVRGTDWVDLMTAPTDTENVSIKYDKVVTINSGNDSGCIRERKMWHPMEKNLKYRDTEEAGDLNSVLMSTTGKQGMGDYYVMDMWVTIQGGATSLLFDSEATYYWHEK